MTQAKLRNLSCEDRIEIEEIIARFAWLHDDRHYNLFHLIYTPDVELDLTYIDGAVFKGIEACAKELRASGPRADHQTMNISIYGQEDGTARARSRYITHFEGGRIVSGEFLDIFRRTPAGWRLSLRRFVRRLPLPNIGTPPADFYEGWLPGV